MFVLQTLDVAIGLVLVFLLVSLILTSVHEAIQALVKTRAKELEIAIAEIFQGSATLARQFYQHPLIYALYKDDAPSGKQLPSYIPREVFSAAFSDLVASQQVFADSPVGGAYRALARTVGFDPARVRREIEDWYDAAMDRAAGRFKRKSQGFVFFLALAGSIVLNINAIVVGQYFAVTPPALDASVSLAESTVAAGLPKDAAVDRYQDQVHDLDLPIGWSESTLAKLDRWYPVNGSFPGIMDAVLLAAGFLLTAFAGMLGAPFWFDVLNRLMVIRATVKPKEKSPDEPSEDGGASSPRDPSAAKPAPNPVAAPVSSQDTIYG